jgi:hypothetical protein
MGPNRVLAGSAPLIRIRGFWDDRKVWGSHAFEMMIRILSVMIWVD